MGQKRRIGSRGPPAWTACQKFVRQIGIVTTASTSGTSRNCDRMATQTIGRPMPVTPLTMPPMTMAKAMRLTMAGSSPSTSGLCRPIGRDAQGP